MKKRILKSLALLAVSGAIIGSAYHVVAKTSVQTIYEGVYLDGLNVGGMTKEAAIEAYEEYMEGMENIDLTIQTPLVSYSIKMQEIDVTVSAEDAVEQAYNYGRQGNVLSRFKQIKSLEQEEVVLVPKKQFNKEKLEEKLESEADTLVKLPKNATIKRENDEFIIYEGRSGQEIDMEATIKNIEAALEEEWTQETVKVQAVVEEKEPEYTAEDFQLIDSVLGQFATEYSLGNEERNQNIATGTVKINGTVLMPGEQFSVNETLSPFTEENGYANAGQYVDNKLVDGIGGGVCQVSTTLYNAVLFSELQVDERYPHSLTVGYVPLSRDAAIAGDYMDFKFTNDTEYPIYIEGYAADGVISFAVYGHDTRPENRTIEFETKTIETYEPGDPEEEEDSTLAPGTRIVDQGAYTGYYTELWKYIYEDGELVDSVKVNGSNYEAEPAKVRVGPAVTVEPTTEPEPVTTPNSDNGQSDTPAQTVVEPEPTTTQTTQASTEAAQEESGEEGVEE